MGTSTMGSDLHSDKQDKLVKLQARKKELEQMLASKNEELYRLCVQEVQLTGVMPPEAPLSPDAPRERAASVRSDGTDAPDGDARRRRHPGHRLSTPARRADANFFPSPPHERSAETFSLHSAHALRPEPPPARAARLRDAHFSSSHPDIAAHYALPAPAPAPLLYQYAAQLKAHNRHLAPHHHHPQPLAKRRADGARRTALTRTQTYHLTSHSDYSQHLDAMAPPPPAPRPAPAPTTLPLRERLRPLLVTTDAVGLSPDSDTFSPLSLTDGRGKEKQWYETALDAPTRAEAPRRSTGLRRTPSAGAPQAYEIMVSSGRHSALQSPRSPPVLSPGAVSLESPKNMTVIEQGKCIPYREETKPFEMSDFYKYSTKFRQASTTKPAAALPGPPTGSVCRVPVELPHYNSEQWHGYGN